MARGRESFLFPPSVLPVASRAFSHFFFLYRQTNLQIRALFFLTLWDREIPSGFLWCKQVDDVFNERFPDQSKILGNYPPTRLLTNNFALNEKSVLTLGYGRGSWAVCVCLFYRLVLLISFLDLLILGHNTHMLRLIKSEAEIKLLRQSASLTAKAFKKVRKMPRHRNPVLCFFVRA